MTLNFTWNRTGTIGAIFKIPETATAPTETIVNWGPDGAGYALGATMNDSTKGLAYVSLIGPDGTVLVNQQSCLVNASDSTGESIFFELLNGLDDSINYGSLMLFVDTTTSTTLPAPQRFRYLWDLKFNITDTPATF